MLLGLFAWFRSVAIKKFSSDHTNNTVAVRKLKNISIASELSSLNFYSSVRAERSFVICYPNVVIKPLCSNLDICLNYHTCVYFQSRISVSVISVADRDQGERCFFKLRFSVALLNSLANFATEMNLKKLSTRMHLLLMPVNPQCKFMVWTG